MPSDEQVVDDLSLRLRDALKKAYNLSDEELDRACDEGRIWLEDLDNLSEGTARAIVKSGGFSFLNLGSVVTGCDGNNKS